jgi:hypothetical protein
MVGQPASMRRHTWWSTSTKEGAHTTPSILDMFVEDCDPFTVQLTDICLQECRWAKLGPWLNNYEYITSNCQAMCFKPNSKILIIVICSYFGF